MKFITKLALGLVLTITVIFMLNNLEILFSGASEKNNITQVAQFPQIDSQINNLNFKKWIISQWNKLKDKIGWGANKVIQ